MRMLSILSSLLNARRGHGVNSPVPSISQVSAVIPAAGNSISITYSLPVAVGSGGDGGHTLSMSGGPVTMTYASGAGTATLVYTLSRSIAGVETGTLSYVQPINGVEEAVYRVDVDSYSARSVTNNSTAVPAPNLVSATVNSAGTQINLLYSAAVHVGTSGAGGHTLSMSGGASTMSFASGNDTTTLVYALSRAVTLGETGTLAFLQPSNGIESLSNGADVASFSGTAVVNGSTAAPQQLSATINSAGTQISIVYTAPVAFGAGGNGGHVLTLSGGASAMSYVSGADSITLVYSLARTVIAGETATLAYTQPSNGVEANSGIRTDVATYSGRGVTNPSTQIAPTQTGASINSSGTQLSITYSQSVTFGAGGSGGHTLSMSGGASSMTYASGSGSITLVYNLSRAINSGETGTLAYTQPGGGVEAVSSLADVATYTGRSVANGSTVGAVAGTLSTSFTLTSTVTNADAPFSIGHGFKKGDASSIQTNLASYQVTIKRRWSDNSIKHAIISGRASLSAGVPLLVIVSTGTPPSGTALTSASIQAAAPTASVQCGAIGTVSLASLLASPVQTWVSGPQMVECHYRATVGSGNLSAWFHVRLFANGRMWIRAIVENGYLDNGSGAIAANSNQSYVPTVIIGGVTAYNNGGATLNHYANTRWSVEGWIGADPAVTPGHNAAYLRASRLVPGYGWTVPSAATLNALTQTYTPMMAGDIPAGMSGGGDSAHLGLLPVWDALFATTGDARAYRSVLANSSAMNSRAIVWRARGTNSIPTPSAFPTWTLYGPGNFGEKELTRGTLQWEYHHDANESYLAYMLTGDYWHYESLAMQASNKFFWISSSKGSGTSRIFLHDEIRGIAWALRTVGCYTGIAPTGDTVADNYRTWLDVGGYQHWRTKGPNNPGGNQLGYPVALSTYDETLPLQQAPWMMNYWIAVNGFVWDVEPGFADTTAHAAVRDWMYKGIVGMLGPTGSASFYYTLASNYNITISPNIKLNFTYTEPAEFYSTWGQVYTATFGSANANSGTTLVGASGGDPATAKDGYWGILLPAISYAVEHGATGALAAYSRLTSASNWSVVAGSGFDNYPKWGCLPRAAATPTWLAGQAVNTWREIPGSVITLAVPTNTARTTSGGNAFGGTTNRIDAWNGLSIDTRNSKVYSVANGGHGDYYGNEVCTIDLLANTPAWAEVLVGSSGNVVRESGDAEQYSDLKPPSTHSYYGQHLLERHNRALRWGGSVSPAGGKVEAVASYNIATNAWDAWSGTTPPPPYGYSLLGTSITVFNELAWAMTKHPDTEDFYVLGQGAFRRFRPSAVAPGLTMTSMAGLPSQVGSGIEGATAIDTKRNRLMWLKGNGGLYSDPVTFNLETGASTLQTFPAGAAATALKNMPLGGFNIGAALGMVYVPSLDAYIVRANAAGGRLWKINASTWAVEYMPETGGAALPAGPGGDDASGQQKVYTRLLYVPALGGVVYFPRGNANAWFYLLSATSSPAQPTYSVDFTALTANESPISRAGVWTNASTGTGDNAALSPNNSMQIRLSANGTTRICCETGATNNYDDSLSVVPGFPGNQRITATIYRQAGYTPPTTNHELAMELGVIAYAVNNKRSVHVGFNYAGDYFVAGFNGDLVSWDAPPTGTLSSPWYTAATGAGSAPVDGDIMIAELDRTAKTVKVWQKRAGVSTLVISLQWNNTAQVNAASQAVLNALGNSAGLGALRRIGGDAVEGAFGWRSVLIEGF